MQSRPSKQAPKRQPTHVRLSKKESSPHTALSVGSGARGRASEAASAAPVAGGDGTGEWMGAVEAGSGESDRRRTNDKGEEERAPAAVLGPRLRGCCAPSPCVVGVSRSSVGRSATVMSASG